MFCFSTASQIVYSIVSGNEDGVFELVSGLGIGIIQTKMALDWGKKADVSLSSHDASIFHSFLDFLVTCVVSKQLEKKME